MMQDIRQYTLDELHVGQWDEIAVEVSVGDIDRFADISGDNAPLHKDESFAREQGFPGRVAHGMLIGALVSGFIGVRLPGRFGVLQSLELGFRKPLIPPETVRIKGEITHISQGVGQVTIKVTALDNTGSVLANAKVRSIVRGSA